MDPSSDPSTTDEAEIGKRRTKLGLRVIFAGFVSILVTFFLLVLFFGRDFDDWDRVGPDQSETIELDEGTYVIYEELPFTSDVEITGGTEILGSQAIERYSSVSFDDFRATGTRSIDIDSPGTFRVRNNGPGRIIIGEPMGSRNAASVFGPLALGFSIMGIGLRIIVKDQRHRRAVRPNGGVRDDTGPDDHSPAGEAGPQDDLSSTTD